MNHRLYASLALSTLLLSGCSYFHMNDNQKDTPAPVAGASHATSPLAPKHYDVIATGKVVALSDKELIVDTDKDILFIDLSADDKAHLHVLNKGTRITLRGHFIPAKGGKPAESDVEDVLLDNGSDIPLE